MTRRVCAAVLVCACACSDDRSPGPAGTYRVSLAAVPGEPDSIAVTYPTASDLVLTGDPLARASIALLDIAGKVTASRVVDGAIELDAQLYVPLAWDVEACPIVATLVPLDPPSYQLRFEDDHVRGVATQTVLCARRDPPIGPYFWKFEVTLDGDRVD